MAVAVTIADNADGTGGSAAITGSAAGAANTLFRAEFRGAVGPLAWAQAGTRTGDGAVAVGGPCRAYYLWYVRSVDGLTTSVSPVVCQPLTDATYEAVRTRVVSAVADRLKLLGLAQIPAANVLVRNSADDPAQCWPAAVVLRDATPDQYAGGTNVRDDLGYPVQVLLQDRSDVGTNAPAAKWDLWRETCERAFRNQRLTGVAEVYTCTIEPAVAVDPLPRIYQAVVSAFTIRAMAREVRGIQA